MKPFITLAFACTLAACAAEVSSPTAGTVPAQAKPKFPAKSTFANHKRNTTPNTDANPNPLNNVWTKPATTATNAATSKPYRPKQKVV